MFHEVAHGLGIKNTHRRQGHGARGAEGAGRRARGRQGRHPRPVHDRPGCSEQGELTRHDARGQLRHLPGRASSARCASAPPTRTAGPTLPSFNFFEEQRRVRRAMRDRPLPGRLRQDARRGGRARRAASSAAGRRRLRRRARLHGRHAPSSPPSCRATWRGSAARASRWTSSSSRARTSSSLGR